MPYPVEGDGSSPEGLPAECAVPPADLERGDSLQVPMDLTARGVQAVVGADAWTPQAEADLQLGTEE